MTYTEDSIPDLTDRVAVVTGANGGLGLATARMLATKGAHVVMAARDQEKARRAVRQILAGSPAARVEVVELDLASQAGVRAAAGSILEAHPRVDILVLNAGVMAPPQSRTEDGFELQLGVNHLGHWTLTSLLLPALLAAPRARVVAVTSMARHFGRSVDHASRMVGGRQDPWLDYSRSKLANYHFGLGLHAQFARGGVHAMSLVAHPGLTNSDLQPTTLAAGGGGWMAPVWALAARYAGMDVAHGAMPQVRAATDPGARSGQLYGPRFVTLGPAVRVPVLRPGSDGAIRTLWQYSERETGVPIRL